MLMTRRRLIAISALAVPLAAPLAGLPAIAHATTRTTRQWTGQALGARASIRLDHPDAEAIAAMVPMKRAGKPEEVAALVAFLASEPAAYISGQIISINGAMI